MVPMMWRMMSLDETPTGRRPRSSKRIVSGTRNHCLPSAMATAVSVEPIPVAKAALPRRRVGVGIGSDDHVSWLHVPLGDADVADPFPDLRQQAAGSLDEVPEPLVHCGVLGSARGGGGVEGGNGAVRGRHGGRS